MQTTKEPGESPFFVVWSKTNMGVHKFLTLKEAQDHAGDLAKNGKYPSQYYVLRAVSVVGHQLVPVTVTPID